MRTPLTFSNVFSPNPYQERKESQLKYTVLAVTSAALLLLVSGCSNLPEESQTSSSVSVVSQVFTSSGTWTLSGAVQNGESLSSEATVSQLGGTMVLELYKDGTAHAQMNNSAMDGNWSQNDNIISLTVSSGDHVQLTVEDQTLRMDWEGMDLIFEKDT